MEKIATSAEMGEFRYEGHRIEFDSYGEGERVLVLIHGLLMNRRMFERLGPALAERGNRVICVDLLGHGRSDRPEDLRLYSMPLFARQVVALLDDLELDSAVVGGTSLGANVALELATHDPERVSGLFIEMPVLDNALPAVAASFAPVLLGLRVGRSAFEVISRLTSAIPRTNYLIDIGLDWVRQRPGPSGAVLEGLLLGETAPHREERQKIVQPTLIVGHPRDPVGCVNPIAGARRPPVVHLPNVARSSSSRGAAVASGSRSPRCLAGPSATSEPVARSCSRRPRESRKINNSKATLFGSISRQ